MNLPRLLRTVRYLRPVQIYGRALFRLRPTRLREPVVARVAASGAWQPPVSRPRSYLGRGRFALLGEEHELTGPGDWTRSDLEKLWLYNLHYFEDLCAADAAGRRGEQRELMLRWVHENPPAAGIGWDPYPCSLRVANWVKWALAGGELDTALERSLALQAEHLSQRVEYHLQGNHLIANAKGLAFAGLFFRGAAADRWLSLARGLLEQQLPEQILSDGGHCERSPMYHALVLEDLLDLVNLASAMPAGASLDAPRLLEPRVAPMLAWLRRMLHPDGEIAFFNDAALGIAPTCTELVDYASRLGLDTPHDALGPLEHLAASGYVRIQRGPATLIADVGEIGPPHLTGHAHADTLSFELSLAGRRVLVNSGTSVYGTGEERTRQRSTSAHNTLEIDGESSSEVWAGFRTGRRARPSGLELREEPGEVRLCCRHDGYRHRPGRPRHERSWRLYDARLELTDRILGSFGRARASFHLAPGIRTELAVDGSGGSVHAPEGTRARFSVRGGRARLEATTHHPRFGVSLASQVLRIELLQPECSFDVDWS